MAEVIKISGWVLFSAVKFLLAPGSIYALGGYSFWETIFISISGGWLGVIGFYYFGKVIFKFFRWLTGRFRTGPPKPRKRMTKMNRTIVKLKKHRMGLIGLALITPSLISIPVGGMLAARYFSHHKRTLPVFFAAVVLWAFILTALVSFFDLRLNFGED